MFLEIELKLSISPEAEHIKRLFDHPLLSSIEPVSEELISRYFDTAELSLKQHGFSLRIREAQSRTIQTLKADGIRKGDCYHRQEWDQPIAEKFPNLAAFTENQLYQPLQAIVQQQPLIELFETKVNRTQWNLPLENGTQIELVLDQGVIRAATHSVPLNELELELKQGDEAQIEKIAAELKKTIPLTVELRSKAQRGYALYTKTRLGLVAPS